MSAHHRFTLVSLLCLPLVGACGITDPPSDAEGPFSASLQPVSEVKVTVCHGRASYAHLIEIAPAALGAHLAHGDYVARLLVDSNGTPGDGVHFRRITDAVAAARDARFAREERAGADCRITIHVAAGSYLGTFAQPADPGLEQLPLVIDVPDVTLLGAHAMVIDGTGRATGASASGQSSVIGPVAPLPTVGTFSMPILYVNGEDGGYQGNGVVVEGFAFNSGRSAGDQTVGGAAVVTLRVRDVAVRGNLFEKGFSESIDLRASTGLVSHNHLGATDAAGGGTCDICLAGPGSYEAVGNRLFAGGIPGILVVPATGLPVPPGVTPYALPAAAVVTATLENNEVRDHLRLPVGVGIRIGAIGIGAPNVSGRAEVNARNNLLVHNRFGIIVEAAFPVANTTRRGDIELSLAGNGIHQSCQAALLVSFSRHTTGLGLSSQPYLIDSSFTLSLGGDLAWEDAWYSHPAGFGNSLVVDGSPIPNGSYSAYDGSVTCVT